MGEKAGGVRGLIEVENTPKMRKTQRERLSSESGGWNWGEMVKKWLKNGLYVLCLQMTLSILAQAAQGAVGDPVQEASC